MSDEMEFYYIDDDGNERRIDQEEFNIEIEIDGDGLDLDSFMTWSGEITIVDVDDENLLDTIRYPYMGFTNFSRN